MNASDAIILENVSFTYKDEEKPALKGVSLTIPRNKTTALIGPVGAGKTTLLRTLNGIIPNFIPGVLSGSLIVDGLNVHEHTTEELATHINLLLDDPSLQIIGVTVEEDIAFGPQNLAVPREEIWKRIEESMAKMRLTGYGKRNTGRLSGGEMQLLAMAGSLAMKPKILAMDEPVAMLDPIGKEMVFNAIEALNQEKGLTTIVAESGSDIESVCEFADYVILMQDGQVVTQGLPAEIFADRQLMEKAGMRVPQITHLFWDMGWSGKQIPVKLESAIKQVPELHVIREIEPRISKFDSEDILLEARNIKHTFQSFPPVEALKGLDLSIRRGEFVALIGQNGSGKSTLAYHLVGVLKPTNPDAEIRIGSHNVITEPVFETAKKINYVFQNPNNQLFNDTFGEEVEYGPKMLGYDPDEVIARGKQALEQVGMLDLKNFYLGSMTRSESALLGLASVLSIDPQIIIADEPTKGLDVNSSAILIKALTDLCKSGGSVVFITHDMELAALHATRVVVMADGKIILEGDPHSVFSEVETLGRAKILPPQVTRFALGTERWKKNPPLTIEEFLHSVNNKGMEK